MGRSSNGFEGVAVGDCHLDKLFRHFGEKAIPLQIAEIRKPLDYAKDNGIRRVWFLGDIADDEQLSDEAKIALIRLLNEYDGVLDIDFITGNHDVRMNGVHSLQVFEELQRFGLFKTIRFHTKPKQVTIGGVRVNFLPFPATRPPKDFKADKQVVNIAHLERPGALRDNGTKITKGGVPHKDKDHWLIGHLHTMQQIGLNYYPGMLYQSNFGEKGKKGFVHFRYEPSGKKVIAKYDWIETTPAFRFVTLNIKKGGDLKKVKSNPLWLYRLYIAQGVKLPASFLVDHPNIVHHSGYSTQKELVELKQAADLPKFNIKEQLRRWLAEKRGFSPKEVRMAMKIDKERLQAA